MATKRKPVKAAASPARPALAARLAAVNERPIDGPQADLTPERHVNGIPVSSLPSHIARMITYSMTDEGIAEANAKRVDSQGEPASGVRVGDGNWEKTLQQREDQPWLGVDPLLAAANAHREPGMQYRGLSPTAIAKRTLRGWEPVKEPNGDDVRIGNLILGKMPIKMARRRNEYYRRQGASEFAAATEQLKVNQERVADEAKRRGIDMGVAPLLPGETLHDHNDPDRSGVIGVHSQRGFDPGADAAI